MSKSLLVEYRLRSFLPCLASILLDVAVGGVYQDPAQVIFIISKNPYKFNPYSASLDFFSEIVLILRSALHLKNRTFVMQIWHKKLTNHGAWRK
jgi:hypothetical protein